MNPAMAKAMVEMWVTTTLRPIVTAALRAAIPADLIAGALVGAAVSVARTAGWKRSQLAELLEEHWTTSADEPPLE